jgi:uncharacterized protein YbcC (UPF0753/DUF2309 family)
MIMNAKPATEAAESHQPVLESIRSACRKMPPLWPLANFVAVNPFVGLSHLEFSEAARLIRRVAHGNPLLPPSEYLAAWERNEIHREHLAEAADLHGANGNIADLISALSRPPAREPLRLSVADALDARDGSHWGTLVVEEVSKWCAAYYDDGQALWRMPWRSLPIFRAWKRGAVHDRTPEVAGLPGFRSCIAGLPDDASLAIQIMLEQLQLPPAQWEEFLHRQLMTVRGWAGYVQYRVRESGMRGTPDESLAELLAVRLAYDYALHRAFGPCPELAVPALKISADPRESALVVWQDALEIAHREKLLSLLANAPAPVEAATRPDFQAIFCIDVRSEVFRRALESVAPGGETIGFAGFFGFPIETVAAHREQGESRCPVLLLPSHRVREAPANVDSLDEREQVRRLGLREAFAGLIQSFKTTSITCFPFVESLGLGYGAPLMRDALALPARQARPSRAFRLDPPACGCGPAEGIPLEQRVTLAEGALRNMGLIRNFGRIVLVCGHGGRSANNPFASSLDCGACGGHAGDANARVAVAVLNDTTVRGALAAKGLPIPADTLFVAGLHNTTTDEVTLFDAESLPASHRADLAALEASLQGAGELAREARSRSLGLDGLPADRLRKAIERKSSDWAEVRPEWGLAGNQAFIAAPRERTRSLDLGGRAFLHNYDHRMDPEDRTLELILCAPMVVANWINLQYFASAANNELFGSGNKVLHNVVGKIGVLEGNGGDLRTGLPWQSVHTGTDLAHLPLRLTVIIEAPRDRIDGVLARQESVRQLVENRWLHLHAWEDEGRSIFERVPGRDNSTLSGSWREAPGRAAHANGLTHSP